ncbi:hypothetical protein ABW21_db0201587 [Orbilia brochopaga]|nr:hypothetical protein ABW21_db0201587 [Drechslerella brochopaga]
MEAMLDSGKFSDFKITCKDKEWNVHKVVLCSQSDYFARACEAAFKERATGEINLSCEPQESVQQMLKFLYSGNYGIQTTIHPQGVGTLTDPTPADLATAPREAETRRKLLFSINMSRLHVAMYTMGDKYLIPTLKALALEKFRTSFLYLWTTEHWCILDDIAKKSTPDGALQTAILEFWLAQSTVLLHDKAFVQKLQKFPDMELELYRRYIPRVHLTLAALQPKVEEVTRLQVEKSATRKDLEDRIESMARHTRCRHCDLDFNAYVENIEGPCPGYTYNAERTNLVLRCIDCSTKHY